MPESLEGTASQEASRAANERFHTVLADSALLDRLIPFLCECADAECLGRVEMTLGHYAEVHVDRSAYVIMHGHATVDGERPIESLELFDVVRKKGNSR
jgi:hypothetical protein